MPAVYAIAEIANSSDDLQVKTRALGALAEPLRASQVPIRNVAIEAVSSFTRGARSRISLEAVKALAEPVRSGNNGVRIPAINATSLQFKEAQIRAQTRPRSTYSWRRRRRVPR
jgi:hypothetical protein